MSLNKFEIPVKNEQHRINETKTKRKRQIINSVLVFRWTVSRARYSYGYNICSLYVDGKKVSSCNGGGYDMKGTALGNWTAYFFKKELLKLKKSFYGLTFHDPNYDPGKEIIDNKTIEEREKNGGSLGLERYQAFHSASSKMPTEKHVIPLIDGACGMNTVEKILNALGCKLRYISGDKNGDIYLLQSV